MPNRSCASTNSFDRGGMGGQGEGGVDGHASSFESVCRRPRARRPPDTGEKSVDGMAHIRNCEHDSYYVMGPFSLAIFGQYDNGPGARMHDRLDFNKLPLIASCSRLSIMIFELIEIPLRIVIR